jgi:D-beta-D-heptose 7-phosphate kinase/D-beta-D-heptose 1-phosphate adenosyltransferase
MNSGTKDIKLWKDQGLRIVFTNGVFDILHVGHVTYLGKAAELGDKLVVGMNSDASVKRLGKGSNRPINPEAAREKVLGALRMVDAVMIFDADTPIDLIREFRPDILVKGGDYDPEVMDEADPKYIVGSKEVRDSGGAVISIPLVDGFSTTNILRKSGKA